MKHYIGIDLGTSSMKLILMDELGQVVLETSSDYPVYFPRTGWSEQDPADWVSAMKAGVRQCADHAHKIGEGSEIAGIGIGGQMHGLVPVDKDGQVIRPAILWNDGRADKETRYLNQEIGEETLVHETANIAFAGFMAPKILWMREYEPALYDRMAYALLPKDYLNYILTGRYTTDVSDASGTLLFDPKRRCWSEKMLRICGLIPDQMPEIHESWEIVGTVKPELADEMGLSGTVAVVAGAGDNAAAAIGTGTVRDGDCNISLGTSGTVFISSDEFRLPGNPAIHAMAHANGKYHLMGCMLSAASCNKWWLEDIVGTGDYDEVEKAESKRPLGENPVIFLPYLMGERSPHNDPSARGMFIGMSMNSTREDLSLAVLEGVAFGLRDSIEIARASGLTIRRSTICGGGARSALWKKIIASVCQIEVVTVEREEGPSMGAAILAAVGCGLFPDVETAAGQLAGCGGSVLPDEEISRKYEGQYRRFRELYRQLKGHFTSEINSDS